MDCNCNDEASGVDRSNGLPGLSEIDVRQPLNVAKSKRLRINIGGEVFVTLKQTFDTIPGTRLANLNPSSDSYDPVYHEYFFDRNPLLFSFILEAYRTGHLHFPNNICAPLFKEELDFWGLKESRIATCCWKTYVEYEQDKEALNKLNDAIEAHRRLSHQYEETVNGSHIGKFRFKIWTFLEDPSSSTPAMVWSVLYLILLLISVTTMVMETHPKFRMDNPPGWEPCANATHMNPLIVMYCTSIPLYSVKALSHICNGVFLIEIVVRFCVWPQPHRFLFYAFNVIDVLSIIPISILTIINWFDPYYWSDHANPFVVYIIISVTGVMRSLRILKIIKHNNGLRVMILAVTASAREIMLLLLLMVIGMLIFATMIYFAEFQDAKSKFTTIPQGFWWSLITMTTVGYGDMVPFTLQGQIVGAACAVTGILAMALPIPVIANNFNTFYNFAKLRDDMNKREKALKVTCHATPQGTYQVVSTTESHTSLP